MNHKILYGTALDNVFKKIPLKNKIEVFWAHREDRLYTMLTIKRGDFLLSYSEPFIKKFFYLLSIQGLVIACIKPYVLGALCVKTYLACKN